MQAPTRVQSGRLLYQEYDRISIPEDVPALGVKAGDEGVIRGLNLRHDRVFAFVMITYSTGQLRGWDSHGDQTRPQSPLLHHQPALKTHPHQR